ncbi:MAG: hypothetical protein LBT16_11050 [Treponema sp.]|nr:hypothetical protein [Treponema sp.]
MKAKKRVLIVTDNAKPARDLADSIAKAAPEGLVTIKSAADFSGSDILPADICFFGCVTPRPSSFSHVEEVLFHINLAGRPCGLFSPDSQEALDYLSGIVQDSELAVIAPPFLSSSKGDVKVWAKNILRQR